MRRAANHPDVVKAFRECGVCGKDLKRKQIKYCSWLCMAAAYRTRLTGSANPHFKGITKTCVGCGTAYARYSKASKYCSHECYVKATIDDIRARGLKGAMAPRLPREQKSPKRRGDCPVCGGAILSRRAKTCGWACGNRLKRRHRTPSPNNICAHCSAAYHTYEKDRLYCSYPCFIASGGPLRAGLEAAKSIMKYGAKKDANHAEIINAMRQCGVPVYDTASLGNGFPDCVAWVSEQWRLVEIKNKKTGYGKRGLNPIQRKWAEQWKGGPIILIHTIEEALAFSSGDFSKLKIVQCGSAQEARALVERIGMSEVRHG